MIETPSVHPLSDPLELSDVVLYQDTDQNTAVSPVADTSIPELLAFFAKHKHLVVVSHARPDGDAIGSVLAMGELLRQLGCTTHLALADPAPAIYRALPGLEDIHFAPTLRENTMAPGRPDGMRRHRTHRPPWPRRPNPHQHRPSRQWP